MFAASQLVEKLCVEKTGYAADAVKGERQGVVTVKVVVVLC